MRATSPRLGLNYDPDSLAKACMASWLPPTDEYQTTLAHFPGNNVHAPWGISGYFFATVSLYLDGELMARLHSGGCAENGHVRFDFDDVLRLLPPFSGMIIVEYSGTKGIPLEVYTAHIHRKTGTYFACNINGFSGIDIYPEVRKTHMDNVMFMPGLAFSPGTETSVVVLNPFKIKFHCQIHLIFGDATQQRSDVLELKPMSLRFFSLEKMFPGCLERVASLGGRSSLCVSSQFKQVSYLLQRDRETGIVTTLDHLHSYILY